MQHFSPLEVVKERLESLQGTQTLSQCFVWFTSTDFELHVVQTAFFYAAAATYNKQKN